MKVTYSKGANRYERRKEETRQKIVQVAMKLFYEQGFDSTTLEQVAEEADIARKTLYNHFPIKEDIIVEYLNSFVWKRVPEIDQLIQEHPDTRSRMVTVLNRLIEWTKQLMTKELFRIYISYLMQKMLTASHDEIHRSGAQGFMYKIIKLGRESGEIRRDLPIEILVSQADNIRVSMGMRFLMDPEGFNSQEYITQSVELFLCGADILGKKR